VLNAEKGGMRMKTDLLPRPLSSWLKLVLAALLLAAANSAAAEIRLLKGQTVYVPAYSHIYYGDREQPFYLTVTLSIRNTDPVHPITIVAVDYFDSAGKLLKQYLEGEVKLGAMTSTRYVVKESDKSGGSGANFIVRWKSAAKVTEPVMETIMISTSTQQGISFTSRGQAIKEDH
jgi:hypothetical protein